jgi:hypothetical protein
MRFLLNVAALLAIVFSATLISLATISAHYGPCPQDRHMFEYMGQCIVAGRPLYVACWDNKPPMLPWINAGVLALSGDSTVAISVAAGVAAGITVLCVVVGTWLWLGRYLGSALCLLASLIISLRFYDACTNGTEAYATMFESVAALLLVLGWRAVGWRAALGVFLSGAVFALAVATKQNAVGGPVAGVVTAIILSFAVPTLRRRLLGLALAGLAGLAVTAAIICLILARQSLLDEAWYAVFTYNRLFVREGYCWFLPSEQARWQLSGQLTPIQILFWLSGVSVLAVVVRWRRPSNTERSALPAFSDGIPMMMAIWLVIAAWTVGLGAAHLERYWYACYVPMFWLSAHSFHLFSRSLAAATPRLQGFIAASFIAACALLLQPGVRQEEIDLKSTLYYATEQSELRRLREIAVEVDRRTQPGDSIYVWGLDSGVYRFSHRFAPCRFFELLKVAHVGRPAQFMADEVIASLTRTPPKLILLTEGDVKAVRAGTWCEADVTGLRRLLDARYRQVAEIRGRVFFERSDASVVPASLPASATAAVSRPHAPAASPGLSAGTRPSSAGSAGAAASSASTRPSSWSSPRRAGAP